MKNLFTLLVLSLLTVPSFAARYHVKTTGSDAAAGTNWTAAFATLQKALATATSGDEIWVAAGTYYPDEGPGVTDNDRNAHFTMKNGVAIYGGFPATGNPTMTNRNWVNNPTILSGEIQQDNAISNNTYNIIYNFYNNLDVTSLLDGFTVSGGCAYGIEFRTFNGGGVHNRNTAPSFQNCTFSGNQAIFGGGMYNEESSPTLVNCSFQANEANRGGGIYNINVSHLSLTNCSFSGNKARASQRGAGIFSSMVSSFTLTNCSFSGNNAGSGGALYNDLVSSLTLTNCIIWGNSTPQIRNSDETLVYSHCLIEGLNPAGTGNLDGTQPANNPLFVSQPDFNTAPTTTGNLRLQPCSPAINAGTNGTFTNADKDLDGNTRIVNTTVDLGAYEAQAAGVFHVKPTGSDANDGLSWNTAFRTLQKALQSACSGTPIWVAAGTYYPDEGGAFSDNDRNAHFTMKNGVAIYGGFPATGNPTMTNRNWVNNPTILSGEIQQDNDIFNNTYNIIYNFYNNLDATSLLDGFTVSGGYADGSGYRAKYGSGVHNRNTAPAFLNCTFSGNQATLYGGGMYNEESSPTLVNCSFQANQATHYGGGMFNFNAPPFILTNCSFSGNKAEAGGGIYTSASSSLTLINCSFSANQANTGGALFNREVSSLTLTNCIIWGNSTLQIRNSGETSVYSYCLIEGLNPPGVGNLNGTQPTNNPLFVNQPDLNAAPTTTGNLRLQPCSPAINAGTNGSFTNIDKDIDRNSRIAFTTIDLGAYESQSAPTAAITPTISSTSPSTCGGSNGSITLSGFSPNTTYAVTYTKGVTNFPAADFTADANGIITLTGLSAGGYTHIIATYGTCVSNAATATLTDPVKPALTLSTIPVICAGATSFSIPYTNPTQSPNTYSISGTGITGVTDGSLTNPINVTLSMGASGSSIPFTLTVKNSTTNCESAPIMGSVTVNPASVGGSIVGSTTVCAGTNSTLLTLANHTGDIQKWQASLNADFSGANDIANTTNQFTATNLTQTTYYRAIVKSGVCETANSTTATVTVNTISVGGSIAGSATVCAGTNSTLLTLANHTGDIQKWQSADNVNFTNPIDIANTTNQYTATNLTQTTYYRAVVKSGVCSEAVSTTSTLTVNPVSVGGSIAGSAAVCIGTNSTVLTLANHTGDIQKWQSALNVDFSGANDITNTTNQFTANNLTQTTYYRAVVKSGVCEATNSALAMVQIHTKPTITLTTNGQTLNEGNSATLCQANQINSLQFSVGTGCVVGSVLWRTQAAPGEWSEWSANAPTTQPGNSIAYHYQAACDPNCSSSFTQPITLRLVPHPTDFALSGGGISFCQTPLSIPVESSQAGVSYQLKRNNVNLSSPLQGTGNPLSFSGLTQAGTYSVVATTAVGGCSRTLSDQITIQTRNAPTAYNLSGGGASCSGTPVSITLANSQIGVLYQLKRENTPVGSPVPGTGNTLSFPPQNTAGNYTAVALTQCADLAMNNTVSITSVVTPSTFTLTGGGISCGTALPVGLNDSQTGVFYQLYRGSSPVGTSVQGTGNALNFGNHLTQGTYTILATRAGECPTTMLGSVSIDLIDPPALFTVTGGGVACPGGVSISLSGSQNGINYQLKRGTTVVSTLPGTDNPLFFPNQTVTGTYTVEAVSEGNCTRTMSGNAIVTAAGTLPNVYSMTGGGAFCNNVPVALGLSDSQKNVYYQLQRNTPSGFVNVGTAVQGTGSALALGTHSILGEYRVVVNSACLTEMTGRKSINACNARIAADNGQRITDNGAFAQVMPNPVSNTLNLKVNEAKGQKVNVILLDASGRALLQRAFVPETNQHQEEFGVSELPTGMYFLQVSTSEHQATLKVVKVE